MLGLRRVLAVGQRRQGLKAALPPGAGRGLRAPLLFIFTQNVPGFFCVPQRALSILLLQPLPVLKELKRKANVTHTQACMKDFYVLHTNWQIHGHGQSQLCGWPGSVKEEKLLLLQVLA